MKECCRFKLGNCAAEKNPQPEENFAKDKKRKDGLTPHCKSCLKVFRDTNKEQRNETIKKWRLAHPEKMMEYRRKDAQKNLERTKKWRAKNRLKFLYGISNEDWKSMFDRQDGKCAICLTHAKDLQRGLCVDHSHLTNKIRGLLCHTCNKAIGLLKDDTKLLERSISYLSGEN